MTEHQFDSLIDKVLEYLVIPKTFEIILGFAIFLVVFTKKISFSLAESYIPLKFMLLYIPYF